MAKIRISDLIPNPLKSNHPSSPQAILSQMLRGYQYSQLLYIAAKTNMADILADGEKDIAELARLIGAKEEILGRVIHGLILCGLMTRNETGRFQLTPLGESLRSDAPGSLSEWAIFIGEVYYPAWGGLLHALRTGQTAFDHIFQMGAFEYLEQNPDARKRFNQFLLQSTKQISGVFLNAFDLSSAKRIVDIGGGQGAFLCMILQACPHLQGILFDRPSAMEDARKQVKTAGLSDRCEMISGDFFDSVPRDGDIYILKWVLQDWEDAKCLTILWNCRNAMGKQAKLLVFERIVPEHIDPSSIWVDPDLHLMVFTGGKERTEAEHRALLSSAGFKITRIIRTDLDMGIIEANPK